MKITAQQLCQLLNGHLEGDPNVLISKPSKIEEGENGSITFLANPKYASYAYTTKASAILVSKDFKPEQAIQATLIRVDDVYASIGFLLEKFGQVAKSNQSVSPQASLASDTKIEDNVGVGAFTVISEGVHIQANTLIHPQVFVGKNVRIGKNVTLHPGVRIYHDCIIGDNCIIHSNVVIGSDGFGFAPQADGSYKKVPQIGNVIIESDVEIGANTVVDRATMGSTIIRKGVKLDNLIQVAHNVVIDEHTVIAAQTGIAGSAKVGKQCMIGGQVGIAGHLKVADRTKIQGQSGIGRNITKTDTAWYGTPAFKYGDYMRSHILFQKLPALEKRLRILEKKDKES